MYVMFLCALVLCLVVVIPLFINVVLWETLSRPVILLEVAGCLCQAVGSIPHSAATMKNVVDVVAFVIVPGWIIISSSLTNPVI